MEKLKVYDDDSNTPKLDRTREDSSETSPHHLPEQSRRRKCFGSGSDKTSKSSRKRLSSTTSPKDSDSESSDSDDDSASDGAVKNSGVPIRRSSGSSEVSSMTSSATDSEHTDGSKKSSKSSKEKALASGRRDRRPSSSSKVSSRRSRSRSGSKGRRRRRSSDRHRRSRSREHRHRSSRYERRSGRRSRSRSHSRDRHSHHRGRDHRRRDGHRRRRSSSRDGHRHRRRSSSHRHRRHSRSPDHKKSRHSSAKKRRSRSPQPSSTSRTEESASGGMTTSSTATPGSSRPPAYRTAGVKFTSHSRGTPATNFKDHLREEYRQKAIHAEHFVSTSQTEEATGPVPLMSLSNVATVSAGTGVMGSGGLGQALVNQMQMMQQQQQYLPGQPGCLTPAQKELNQRFILQSTGRTKEQVEAQYGVKISNVYNENTNNLVELAQRQKKRTLLWQNNKKKNEPNSTFNAVPVLPGQSRSENQKFARLLGCRKGEPKEEEEEENVDDEAKREAEEKAIMENAIRNSNLEAQYESSRRFTHSARGQGLGYSTTLYQPH